MYGIGGIFVLPKTKLGKRALIIAEKPDEGTWIAAVLGGVEINGEELTVSRLLDEAFANKVKKYRAKGYLEGKDQNGTPYLLTWGYGHLYELYQAKDYNPSIKWNLTDFPFFPKEYKYKPMEDKKEQVKRINRWLTEEKTDYVIAATDPDREGEGIFALIYQGAGSTKKVYRLWLDDLTEAGITKAFLSLKPYHDPYLVGLRESQAARSIVDWMIGANFTVLCTKKFGSYQNGKQEMLSIGRVQTATLSMVVKREREIERFIPEVSYAVEAHFRAKAGEYKGVWKIGKEEKRFSTEEEAKKWIETLKAGTAKVGKVTYTIKREAPPLLFDITTLQAEAAKRYKYSVQLVLDTVQSLYEKQLVSYPRTDSRYLTPDVGKELPDILKALPSQYALFLTKERTQQAKSPGKRVVSTEPMAHYALIPTKTTPNLMKLSEPEQRIYDLIVRSLLSALSSPAEWGHTEIVTLIKDEPFVTTGKTLLQKGWRELYETSDKERIPQVSQGEEVEVLRIAPAKKETEPPKRYTDGTLVKAMENAGNYLEERNDSLGGINRSLLGGSLEQKRTKDVLKKVGGIGTPATRTGIITRLLEVGYLKQDAKTSILTPTEKAYRVIETIPVDAVKSPKYTAEIEEMLNEIVEGKRTKEEVIEIVREFVEKVSEEIKKSPFPYGAKSGSTHPPKEEKKQRKDSVSLQCPLCGSALVEQPAFYGCSNYKNGCRFTVSKEIGGHKVTKRELKAILKNGKTTQKVKFVSQSGKTYEDYLVLSNGRVMQSFRAKE